MIKIKYGLSCLSPVHVGTGTQFSHFDGVYEDKKWYVIDLEKVIQHGSDASNLAKDMSAKDFAWVNWLRKNKIQPSDVSTYSCPCIEDPNTFSVRESFKDVYGNPYLPGSSIKGFIRTAIAWNLLKVSKNNNKTYFQDILQTGRNPSWLAKPLEKDIFGRDPNHDIMRAIHVCDTSITNMDKIEVGLTWTYTIRSGKLVEKSVVGEGDYKTFVEWFTPSTDFILEINLDDFLFKEKCANYLGFKDTQINALKQMHTLCNSYSHSIIEQEKTWYRKYGMDSLYDFYCELEKTQQILSEGSFLINIGWGGGWEIKTVGDLLRNALGEDDFTTMVRQKYGVGKNPRTREVELKAPFPKTRHIGYEAGAPMWPLGWVKAERIL